MTHFFSKNVAPDNLVIIQLKTTYIRSVEQEKLFLMT